MSSVGPTVYRGSVAPTTGRIGDMWVDDTGFPILNFCTDDSPLTWIPVGGMRPIASTKYTSGSGTHTFLSAGQWCRITVQAGGGAGGKGTWYGGGGGGEYLQMFVYIPESSLSYSVGAGGTAASGGGGLGGNGGDSYIGRYVAKGGRGGYGGGSASGLYSYSYGGGYSFYGTSYDDGASGTQYTDYKPSTAAHRTVGGRGGYNNGNVKGLPAGLGNENNGWYAEAIGGTAAGGGDSMMGTGGNGDATTPTTGSGYGGGSGGTGNSGTPVAGSGGIIIVEEFGAW